MNWREFEFDKNILVNGITIKYFIQHYKDGSNLNFAFHWKELDEEFHTGWYGDNHEWGDPERVVGVTKRMAEELSKVPEFIISDYFDGRNIPGTEKGLKMLEKRRAAEDVIRGIIYKYTTKEFKNMG